MKIQNISSIHTNPRWLILQYKNNFISRDKKKHTEVVEFILEKTKVQQKSSRLEEIKL